MYPTPSMYGIFTYIWLFLMGTYGGKYTIHGWYGCIYIYIIRYTPKRRNPRKPRTNQVGPKNRGPKRWPLVIKSAKPSIGCQCHLQGVTYGWAKPGGSWKSWLRWWQLKYVFIFHLYLGKMNPIWRSYFSKGLVETTNRVRKNASRFTFENWGVSNLIMIHNDP